MPPEECLFCRIIDGELPAMKLHEDDLVIAIRDVAPKAPTHILVMPKKHLPSAAYLTEEDAPLLGRMYSVAGDLAHSEGIDESGYRLVTNVGEDGGQTLDHLHMHMLGGRAMGWPPG